MSRGKLSSDARELLEAAALEPGALTEARGEVDVLVRTARKPTSADRARLESLGATVRTVAGDVLTAHIPVGQLERLADLDVVAYIEISQPLAPEQPPTHEQPPAEAE